MMKNSDLAKGKSGRFTASLSAGQSYTYPVVFSEPFADTNYVISLSVNTSNFAYYISERSISGFKIYVYSNAETSGALFDWSAVRWPHFQ